MVRFDVGRRRRASGPIRLAHVFSAALSIPNAMPYIEPLLARGWEVTVICPDGPELEIPLRRGVRWLPHSMRRSIDPLGDFRAAAELARHFHSADFDVVHTHNFKIAVLARVLAGAARVPVIIHTVHGMTWSLETPLGSRTFQSALERIAAFPSDLVLSQSVEDSEALLRTGAVPARKMLVIGNGVPLERFDPDTVSAESAQAIRKDLGVGASDVLVLSPARLVREKGILEVFEAARMLRKRRRDIFFAVAGRVDTEKADAIDEAALTEARAAGVAILGERTDMPELYAACDVVLLASWREGLPRVLIEGAAMGKPLISTEIRGSREILPSTDHGRLVPVRDAAALAEAVARLADDPEERRRIGAKNRIMAHERFDIRTVVDKHLEVYDRLLTHRGLM